MANTKLRYFTLGVLATLAYQNRKKLGLAFVGAIATIEEGLRRFYDECVEAGRQANSDEAQAS